MSAQGEHRNVEKEKDNTSILELEAWILNRVLGGDIATDVSSNDHKPRTYNVFDKHPDFKNRYGWSLMVTQKHLKPLNHINMGFLMVNLTAVSDSHYLVFSHFS